MTLKADFDQESVHYNVDRLWNNGAKSASVSVRTGMRVLCGGGGFGFEQGFDFACEIKTAQDQEQVA